MKVCPDCGVEKALTEFYPRYGGRPGVSSYCKKCESKRAMARHRRDPEHARKVQREWRRRTKYGLTQEQVEEMDARGVCDVCGRSAEEVAANGRSGERLHIDHDHETGVVRGVLCKHCNSALGLAGDDPERLIALAAYLIERGKVTVRT